MLELSGATSVDEAAIELMAGASALAAESDTSFCLVAPPAGPIVRALAVADLIERFEIFRDSRRSETSSLIVRPKRSRRRLLEQFAVLLCEPAELRAQSA